VVHADEEHSIDTDHSGLNKCAGLDDGLFVELRKAIISLRTPTWLERADIFIRNEHYNTEKLRIERLSGDFLPMDEFYINLAIVEQPGENADRSEEGLKGVDSAPRFSPFSVFARQKVETPDKTIQVELATIFNERKEPKGKQIRPRRILIRGRAGVGKTTLCKKIVYDFICRTETELHRSWIKLFDRIL
jgi:predicted NACHT family NTPase